MPTRSSKAGHYISGRTFLCRLPHDADLLDWLVRFATEQKMQMATISVIGAVETAKVAYYDQRQKSYSEIAIDKNLEIVSCTGNISIKEGKLFAHCHAVFSDDCGETFGGHVATGTIIFAAEAHVQEIVGHELVREYDDVTGLALWK
ncbi:MAG: DNA-binding protein [Candidatus Abyssubacteria bacterium]